MQEKILQGSPQEAQRGNKSGAWSPTALQSELEGAGAQVKLRAARASHLGQTPTLPDRAQFIPSLKGTLSSDAKAENISVPGKPGLEGSRE